MVLKMTTTDSKNTKATLDTNPKQKAIILQVLKTHKYSLLFIVVLFIMAIINLTLATNALQITGSNLLTMLGVIPPIFVLIGLLDVWVPRETMIKYMGQDSGVKGLFFAFILGSLAAGPLYAAFPVAAILLKKGARFAYVIFFLGTWTSAKLPLILFEMTSLGVKFTLIHVSTMLFLYLIGAYVLERLLLPHEQNAIVARVTALAK